MKYFKYYYFLPSIVVIFISFSGFAQEIFTAEKILGVGYQGSHPNLMRAYSSRGITSLKTTCIDWQRVEPNPPDPLGTHTYYWNDIDSFIIQHQRNGITEFCIWLGDSCTWATCPHWAPFNTRHRRRPMPEYESACYDFYYNIVERYDRDGINDAPGLLYPVLMYMVESEAQQFFFFEGCSYETHLRDYLAVLGIAYRAMKNACPTVQVGLSAALFPDMFDDFPNSATILDRIRIIDSIGLASAFPDSTATRSFRFIRETICADSIYDFVCFHPLFNWEGLFGMVRVLRGIMDSAGIDKPIIADDAVSGPMFYADGFRPRLPTISDSLYNIIGNSAHPLYPIVDPWFRACQARSVAKNFVVALGLGVRRMWIETTQDWTWFYLLGSPSWAFIGLVDYNLLFPAFSIPRPALHTMKLLKQKFMGYRTITRLPPLIDPARIYLYRFSNGTRPDMYCIWFENHIDEIPENPMPETTNIALTVFPPNRRITRTRIVTSRTDTIPAVDTLTTNSSGILIIPVLNETPVFLENIGSVSIAEKAELPSDIEIAVFPNPFNSSVRISIPNVETRHASSPNIEIFDLNGRRVQGEIFDINGLSVVERSRNNREYIWTPDENLGSGIYLIRATIGGKTIEKRVVYVK